MDDFFKNAWNWIIVAIGGALGVLCAPILQWLDAMIGPAAANLVKVATLIFLLALLIVWKRNFELLGAGGEPVGAAARKKYDAQRARLAAAGLIGETYERWLTQALDRVDVFFEGRARHEDEAPPTWSAPAYDKCLLLAMTYPTLTLFLFWAISNHIGVAEKALVLRDTPETWKRTLAVVSLFALGGTEYRALVESARLSLLWLVAFAGVVAVVAGVVADPVDFAFAFAFAFAGLGALAFAGGVVGAVAVAVAVAFAGAAAGGVAVAVVFAVAGGVAVAVAVLQKAAIGRDRYASFLLFFTLLFVPACFVAALLESYFDWEFFSPILLFFGLFTLLNAPFDWFCLGLTRFLLRYGLARHGWWPLGCALVDAFATSFVVLALMLTLIFGVQLFDGLAGLSGAKPILPVDIVLTDIAIDPWDPKNWWLYALLVSTFFPSLVNLTIGSCALFRGLPLLSPFLASQMPEDEAVPAFERTWVSLLMTGQIAAGVVLAFVVQGAIIWFAFVYALPWIGLEFFELATAVESANYPQKLIGFFAGKL